MDANAKLTLLMKLHHLRDKGVDVRYYDINDSYEDIYYEYRLAKINQEKKRINNFITNIGLMVLMMNDGYVEPPMEEQ